MRVQLRMSGLVARYLPPGACDGKAEYDLPDGASVAELMDRLGIPGDGKHLVIVNDTAIPRAERPRHLLGDGDRISIVPPLKGG